MEAVLAVVLALVCSCGPRASAGWRFGRDRLEKVFGLGKGIFVQGDEISAGVWEIGDCGA